jgi:RNA polymerase sigma-B factor
MTAVNDATLACVRKARTQELLAQAARVAPAQRAELLAEVVELNLPIARSVASRYLRRGIDREDLHQVASLALTLAAQRYRLEHERDFLAFAVPTIRGEVRKHFRDYGWMVRPRRAVQEAQAKVTGAEADLLQELGRSPRPSELAERTGVDLEIVVEALSVEGCFTPTSLDRPIKAIDGDTTALGSLLAAEDREQPAAEARMMLEPVVRRLKERDRRIVYMRFFEERTQQEIGDELSITQMQVSRLLTRIMRDLRNGIERESSKPTVPASRMPRPMRTSVPGEAA